MTVDIKHWVEADKRLFRQRRSRIKEVLEGSTGIINGVTEQHKEEIFYMLVFCLCVPQSKAIKAEEAIESLRGEHFYDHPLPLSIVFNLLESKVRFAHIKSRRLVDARIKFIDSNCFWNKLCEHYEYYIGLGDSEKIAFLGGVRLWLVEQVNGMGLKLASHFSRNVGMRGLAILDTHIIAGLQKRGLIKNEKIALTKSQYYAIEDIVRRYADRVGISMDELDLLLWSQKTGYVFK